MGGILNGGIGGRGGGKGGCTKLEPRDVEGTDCLWWRKSKKTKLIIMMSFELHKLVLLYKLCVHCSFLFCDIFTNKPNLQQQTFLNAT